ncbi:hypothetical protein MNKW57_06430 [Biformimicrobium ophioploci]|uniref:Uncharacterized protein n=1 Tax=Biformimicrobium ophioploci TaxID=3036711 RepID=A0ABQ6LWC1_9GAMM|nr:hypothetical protein MNKW57_06430 [Microbulbifer sp. NKW57]
MPAVAGSPLAGGRYSYLCEGELVPVKEHWQLWRQGQAFVIQSERWIEPLQASIAVQAVFRGQQLRVCLTRWLEGPGGQASASSLYRDTEGGLYRWRSRGQPASSVRSRHAHYFPLLRIFAGYLLTRLAQDGKKESEVLVPWIEQPQERTRLFSPDFSRRRVSLGESGPWRGEGAQHADSVLYHGGQYQDGSRYWLNCGLLLGYDWSQAGRQWQVRLEDYRGHWPGAELWQQRFGVTGRKLDAEQAP